MANFKVITLLCIFDRLKKKSKLLKNEDEEFEVPL